MVEVKLKKRKNCDNELGQKTIFVVQVTLCFYFFERRTEFLFHEIKKSGTKGIAKKGIIEVSLSTPKTRITNTTFRKQAMNMRVPF